MTTAFPILLHFVNPDTGVETRSVRYVVTEPPLWKSNDWIQLRRGDQVLAEFQSIYLLGWERDEDPEEP